jgi:uncharacterized protein YoxC
MPKSSINFSKVSSHSFLHNDRSEKRTAHSVHSDFSHLNEFDFDAKKAKSNFDILYKEAISKISGRERKADKKNTLWEAVVNIKPNTTMEDLKELQKHIEKEFGFSGLQIAVHKDEGHKHPNKKGELVQNLHAHMSFFTLDRQTGRQMMRRELVTKDKLRELQTKTAEILNMDRGVDKRVSGKERLEHKAYKKHIQEVEKYQYNFREYQQQITALQELDAEQKKQLHKLNTEINKIKNDDTLKAQKIEELEAKIQEMKSEYKKTIDFVAKYSELEINSTFWKDFKNKMQNIAHKETKMAQKLQEKQNTINYLDYEIDELCELTEAPTEITNSYEKIFDWVKFKINQLKTTIKSLLQENSELKKENEELKKQTFSAPTREETPEEALARAMREIKEVETQSIRGLRPR